MSNSPLNFTDPSGLSLTSPLANVFSGPSFFNFNDPTQNSPTPNVFSPTVSQIPSILGGALTGVATSALPFGNVFSSSIDVGLGLGTLAVASQVGGTPPSVQDSQFISQIHPNTPIRTQRIDELPIRIQMALQNPDRFEISNNQNNGTFILDKRTGSVQFLTNEEIRPLETLGIQLKREELALKTTSVALDFAATALVSASPIHDTVNDLSVIFTGHDLIDPKVSFDTRNRLAAFMFLVAPGGNSTQVRKGQTLLDASQEAIQAAFRKEARLDVQGGTYVLVDPSTNQVVRTGRTNNLVRRRGELGRDPLLEEFGFQVDRFTDDYLQQRGREQVINDLYRPRLNKINPISPRNPNRPIYLDAASGIE